MYKCALDKKGHMGNNISKILDNRMVRMQRGKFHSWEGGKSGRLEGGKRDVGSREVGKFQSREDGKWEVERSGSSGAESQEVRIWQSVCDCVLVRVYRCRWRHGGHSPPQGSICHPFCSCARHSMSVQEKNRTRQSSRAHRVHADTFDVDR